MPLVRVRSFFRHRRSCLDIFVLMNENGFSIALLSLSEISYRIIVQTQKRRRNDKKSFYFSSSRSASEHAWQLLFISWNCRIACAYTCSIQCLYRRRRKRRKKTRANASIACRWTFILTQRLHLIDRRWWWCSSTKLSITDWSLIFVVLRRCTKTLSRLTNEP